jgi:serine/threonine protein kinase
MKHLRGHINVIELIDVYIDYNTFDKENSDIYIVTELCGLTMWEYLNEKTFPHNPLSEQEIKDLMCQLLSVCVFMHSADILHRDIKPENLLMKGNLIKLIDFGSATKCHEQQQVEHMESVYVGKFLYEFTCLFVTFKQ